MAMSQQSLPPVNQYTGSYTEDVDGDGVRLNAFGHEDASIAYDPSLIKSGEKWLNWEKMAKSGEKLGKVGKSGKKVAKSGYMWLYVAKSGFMWLKVAKSGFMWFKVCTT